MTAGVPLEEKQSVCDLCWYLWARSLGKGCPFKSGTIFIEDEHYLLFSALSRLGYSRVLIRGVLPRFFLHSRTKSRVRKSRTRCASAVPISPNSWAPPIVDNQIEFCENKAQWLLPEGETEIVMSRGKIGRGYEQVGMDFAVRETGIVLPFNRLDCRALTYLRKTRIERLAALQAEIDRHNALEEQRRLSELRSKALDALDGIL